VRDVIPAALADERVDRVVAMVAGVSRREAAQLIAAGAVHLDGGAVTAGSTRVREGADIVIDVERLAAEPPLEADASVPVAVVTRVPAVMMVVPVLRLGVPGRSENVPGPAFVKEDVPESITVFVTVRPLATVTTELGEKLNLLEASPGVRL